jgi:hypothetical protein
MRKIMISISFILPILLMVNLALATVAGEPLIQVTFTTNPIIISPGSDGYIQMTLKNSGTAAAQSVKVTLTSTDIGILVDPYRWVNVGALAVGDSTSTLFKFSVPRTTSSGLYRINFEIDYCQDSSCRTINQFAIVNVQSPPALELTSIKPSLLRPGEKTNMTFAITNKGSSSITNVIFTWTSSGNTILPLGSGNRIVIPMIDANSYYEIPVEVSVSSSATPGVYPLSTTIQYTDRSGANQTISSTTGVIIGGETDFDVSLQESTGNTISLSVANIGVNPATSVAIRVPRQERFSVTGATSVFLGDLNPGDYTIASFQLISRNVTGSIPMGEGAPRMINATEGNLIVEISYTDTTGSRQILQKEVSVRGLNMQFPTSLEQGRFQRTSGFGIWTYVGIGVTGVIAIVAFFKFVKRKKK